MPAEWELHEATWISWPHPATQSFPGSYAKMLPHYARMAVEIARAETLRVNVADADEENLARALLADAPPDRVEFFHIPTDEPWTRDHGAIFLRRKEAPRLAAVNFGFNAWGWKMSPFEEDDNAARLMAGAVSAKLFNRDHFVLEGGSIDVNGTGTLLTTESCLLNPNRNPSLSKEQIEDVLCGCLGVTKVLWLGDGIAGDDTDGHVDVIARFVNEDTVVTCVEEDPDDENYEPLQINLDRLLGMTLADGRPLRVVKLPMPPKILREGRRLPATYANFYITNSSVLLPAYGDPADAWAESVLREVFPARRIVPLDCSEIIWGLGGFHCLTQQQPAIPR